MVNKGVTMKNDKVLQDVLGYFDNEKKEYVITNMYPERPLINYLWSDKVVAKCNQFGEGTSFAGFKGDRRTIDNGERVIFIKDLDTGIVYSPNRNFNDDKFESFSCNVGIGYQKVNSVFNGLATNFIITVPQDDYAISYEIDLQNQSKKKKRLAVFFVVKLFTNLSGHEACGLGVKDEKYGGLTYHHTAFECDSEYTELYFASDKKFNSYAVTLGDIVGTYGSYNKPLHIINNDLRSDGATFEFEKEYYSCVSYEITLDCLEKTSFNFALAIGKDFESASQTAFKHANKEDFDQTIIQIRQNMENTFNSYQAEIPDEYIGTLINIWLKRQVSLGKTWGRVYGKGFRDVLQDITAFTTFDKNKARERIIYTLSHQYNNGNAVRMFDPIYKAEYNDSVSWMPDAICSYIKESGDYGILDEKVSYLNGGEDTIYNHLYKAMEYLTNDVGERGLVLFRRGDWNDSTNGVGNLGKGESVWTSLATVRALKLFARLNKQLNKDDIEKELLEKAQRLTDNILNYGIYDGHFIHGYDDYGNIVGGGEKEEDASFCLNMQTWAVLADVGDKDLQNSVMNQVEEKLKCDYGYVLNDPPYRKPNVNVGRTSYFQPGVIENASVYIHGSMFKAVADCLLGRGDNAYQTVRNVTYINNPNSGMEPYAISNMLIGPADKYRARKAPMSWVTGSAGWMYRALTEYILGVQADYDGIRIIPCVPNEWTSYSVKRKYRNTLYNVEFSRTGKFSLTVDGKEVQGNLIPIASKENCNVKVTF